MLCPTSAAVLSVFAAIAVVIVAAIKWKYKHWERHGVPYIASTFPGGNTPLLTQEKSVGVIMKDWHDEFKSKGYKYGGTFIFAMPILTIVDLELIKLIMVKDFSNFMDRGLYYNERDDPISGNLLNIEGQRWKTLRNKLSPTFTSGKMKQMFQTLVDCSVPLKDAVTLAARNKQPIDVKDVFIRFTADVIGSCAFGIDCNSFKNEENPFAVYGKQVFEPPLMENLRTLFVFSFPTLSSLLRMRATPPDVSEFFWKLVKDTVTYREKNNFVRNDFLQLLIDLKNDDKSEDKLTLWEIAAQAFIFFLGGYETSSTAGSFCMYELAVNQDVQDKLRKEIEEVLEKHGGKITYEATQEMKYTEQVINGKNRLFNTIFCHKILISIAVSFTEALRKYPPIPGLNRVCLKNYPVPGTDFVIKEGTRISISSLALHHDPEYYPNPEKFDPERFSEENKKNLVPYTFMPFGDGPRICIGNVLLVL